jgi:hypothetical protein
MAQHVQSYMPIGLKLDIDEELIQLFMQSLQHRMHAIQQHQQPASSLSTNTMLAQQQQHQDESGIVFVNYNPHSTAQSRVLIPQEHVPCRKNSSIPTTLMHSFKLQ